MARTYSDEGSHRQFKHPTKLHLEDSAHAQPMCATSASRRWEPSLLPRRLIFGDPERSIVRISPDGTRFAFRAPLDGVLNLLVAPIDRIGDARPVTAVTDRNLGAAIVWIRDNRHVVFFREAAGDENWRAWRVDLEADDARPLTPGPGVTCYIQHTRAIFPANC